MREIYDLTSKRRGFPSKWSKDELNLLLDEAHELISRPVGKVDLDRVQPLISVATNELGSRAAKTNFRASLLISVVAILLSLYANYKSDTRGMNWEKAQLDMLMQIEKSLSTLQNIGVENDNK